MAWGPGEITAVIAAVATGIGVLYKSRLDLASTRLQLKKADEESAKRIAEELAKSEQHKSDLILKMQESAAAWIQRQEEANEKLRVRCDDLLVECTKSIKQATDAIELSRRSNDENMKALHALAMSMRKIETLERELIDRDDILHEKDLMLTALTKASIAQEAARKEAERSLLNYAEATTSTGGSLDGSDTKRIPE